MERQKKTYPILLVYTWAKQHPQTVLPLNPVFCSIATHIPGFAHYRHDAGRWNPNYRVFADYEFFLQCVSLWGCSRFKLNPEVLVNYVQSSEGIIGQSSYKDWVTELTSIYLDFGRYSALKDNDATVWFPFLIETYLNKLKNDLLLPSYNDPSSLNHSHEQRPRQWVSTDG
jgi:hypothetical protein